MPDLPAHLIAGLAAAAAEHGLTLPQLIRQELERALLERLCPPALVIETSAPPQASHPNARAHWRRKAEAVANYRRQVAEAAALAARGAVLDLPTATIATTWTWCKGGQRHDPDNLVAWLKPALDGLQDARILADDRDLIHLPPQQQRDRRRLAPGLRLEIRPAQAR